MTRRLNAAIVGAAITPVGVWPEISGMGLAARALTQALDDAGLDRADIDGFAWNLGRPSGEDYDAVVEALGLQLRFVTQFWTHGRFTGSALIVAAMAVDAGLADFVVCVGGTKREPAEDGTAPAPASYPPSDPRAHGMTSFVHHAALAYRAYLSRHDADGDLLADVVLASRAHAAAVDTAYLREPLTRDAYLDAPFLVDPLRALDCFPAGSGGGPMNDYGACVIVGRADAARERGGPVAYVLGAQGLQAGREEIYFGRPGLGLFGQTTRDFAPGAWDGAAYGAAGIVPADVDAFYTYDAFAPLVWMALERFGHCAPGAAPRFATLDRIGPGGALPVNTNGGLLSQGHTAGWGHVVELADQLRGRAGARQITDLQVAQWATVFGDAVILTNDEERWLR